MNKSNVVIFYNYSEFQKPTYFGWMDTNKKRLKTNKSIIVIKLYIIPQKCSFFSPSVFSFLCGEGKFFF